MLLRGMEVNEKDILRDFLYEAIFIPEGVKPPDRSIIEQPELRIYYEDFGREGDQHEKIMDSFVITCHSRRNVYYGRYFRRILGF